MIDWMQDHPAATWLGLAVVLAVVEIFSLDLVLLMFALGAVGGSIAAGFGAPLWLAILIFTVVSVAFLYFVRPPIVHRLHAGPTLTTGHEADGTTYESGMPEHCNAFAVEGKGIAPKAERVPFVCYPEEVERDVGLPQVIPLFECR